MSFTPLHDPRPRPVKANTTTRTRGRLANGSTSWSQTMSCAHCERQMSNFEGGYSRGYNNEPLCHPNVGNRPDCYKLVTIYNHPTPCDRKTCYENHEDFMTYVGTPNEKVPF